MINQNQQPNEPALKDLIETFRKDILLNLNCHHLGTIDEFNPVTQLAKVTINYKKVVFRPNAAGQYNPVSVDYAVIIDAPVIILGGGNGQLTFPIEKGDECLVLFNDRSIDSWYSGSSTSPVPSPRLHSFSDGLVLVGIRSLRNVIFNYNSSEPEFRTKDSVGKFVLKDNSTAMIRATTEVSVDDTKVTVKNASQGLGTLLQSLMTQLDATLTQIQSITVTVDGSPIGINNVAAFTSIKSQLNTIKTNLGNLLT